MIITASLFLLVLFSLIGLIILPFVSLILEKVLPVKYLEEAYSILPYSILCLLINAVSGVYASVLDGLQQNYVRSIIFTLSSIILLVVTILLIPGYGLFGVALSQVVQSIFSILMCYAYVIMKLPHNPLKWRWSRSIFKEIFNYGMSFQFISLTSMLNDPLTKILITRFSGLAFTGYYEIASRVVTQMRAVIVNANQTLLPVIVGITDVDQAKAFYKRTFLYVFIFSFLSMTALSLSAQTLSFIFIGVNEYNFLIIFLLLCLASAINLLTGPTFYTYMASGRLKYLIQFNILLCVLNIFSGYLLGLFFGGIGVIFGWILGLIFSSFHLIHVFHNSLKIKFTELLEVRHLWFVLFCSVVVLAQFFIISHEETLQRTIFNNGFALLFLISGSFFILRKDVSTFLKLRFQ